MIIIQTHIYSANPKIRSKDKKMGNCQNEDQTEQNFVKVNRNVQPGCVTEMKITNYIWEQDYQGLFDFDTKQITKKVLKVQGSSILAKRKPQNKFQVLDQNINKLKNQEIRDSLFRISRKEKMYVVEPIFIQNQQGFSVQKLLWLVVNSLPKQKHRLQEKDIIKLGKQKIRVRQICHADSNPSGLQEIPKLSKAVYENLAMQPSIQKSVEEDSPKKHQLQLSEQTNSEQVCRICLDPGECTNPLITPCKCSGSVRYIHLSCLRTWLSKRLHIQKSQHCITINWLPLSCQMCKNSYKYRIYLDNKKFYTVDIPKPQKPYITIQLMKKSSNGNNGKIFHFVSFKNKAKIMFGRRKDIDVRVSQDISISRAHAWIQYHQQGQLFLSDNNSKFGTLVLVKKGLLVRPEFRNLSLQLGAEVFSFQVARNGETTEKKEENCQEYLAQNMSDYDDDDEEDQEGLENSEEEEEGHNGGVQEEGEGIGTNNNISGVSGGNLNNSSNGGNAGRISVQNR